MGRRAVEWVSGCGSVSMLEVSSIGEEKTAAKRSSKLASKLASKLVALGEGGDSAVSSTDALGERMVRQTSGLVCMPFSEDVQAVLGGVRAGVYGVGDLDVAWNS